MFSLIQKKQSIKTSSSVWFDSSVTESWIQAGRLTVQSSNRSSEANLIDLLHREPESDKLRLSALKVREMKNCLGSVCGNFETTVDGM